MPSPSKPAAAHSGHRNDGVGARDGAEPACGEARVVDRERVIVWAPRGRDAARIMGMLRRHQIAAELCSCAAELAAALDNAGCAVIAQEALNRDNLTAIEGELRRQQAWSDFPFILLARESARGRSVGGAWQALGNVTVLERPRSRSLLTAVGAALRARRRQYEAAQAMAHRDQFLAMLGHELRNPLAAITLATEAERQRQASGERGPPDERSHDIIARQARHLSRLVDGLLDVARVTTGKVVLERVVLDVNHVLEDCVQSFGLRAREGAIELSVVPWPEPLLVRGDRVRLDEVLCNLLCNAIDYSPRHGRVQVSARAEGGACVIEVRDGGIGISEQMLPRVFDVFVQAEVPLDRSRGGLGIGLTVVRSLVEQHGGRVSARSEGLGKGSSFSIELPLQGEGAEPSAPSSRLSSDALLPISVLVVEDNDDLLEMTRDILAGFGCDVSIARDGPSGLERLRQLRPAVAFIDIGLPGLDGYSVARETRVAAIGAPWLVALTGYGQPEDRERALAAGFDQHLTKPVSIAALRRAVEYACKAGPIQRSHRPARGLETR
jgi:signal transduction histidine kinase/ActR/RegA family two-component response regulator